MKIIRNVSSAHPELCNMYVKGFFGNEKGRVVYNAFCMDGKPAYAIGVNGKFTGAATDFYHACDTLLNELGIVKTTFV
jgi:hypothetical protein